MKKVLPTYRTYFSGDISGNKELFLPYTFLLVITESELKTNSTAWFQFNYMLLKYSCVFNLQHTFALYKIMFESVYM